MTMTATELQAYVDAGRVPSTSGTSTISTAITLDGSSRVIFEPNSFAWTGSSSNSLFEYDSTGVANPYPIIFDMVTATSSVSGSSIFRNTGGTSINNFTCDTIDFTATGAYCIDLNEINYSIVPVFRNCRTSGSGALRLRANGGADYWHATSQMSIKGWTHDGSDRVGPAWNFRGTSGLIMQNCLDKGSMGLLSAMNNSWEGPLTLLIQTPRTPAQIINLVTEWDDANDDDAVNCYIGELRTDNSTGTGQHEYVDVVNATLTHPAVDSAVKAWRVMGSDVNNHHCIVVNFEHCEDVNTGNILIGGRCSVWVTAPWYKPGESSDGDTIETAVNTIYPEAFQDRIELADGKLPSADETSAVTYSGSSNETNYAAEPDQYEVTLEG